MKKRIFRAVSLFVCLALLCAAFCQGFSAAAQEDEPAATIYLCVSGIHPLYFFGHAWICIANTGYRTLTVGEVTLQPGEMMSVGLHSGAGMTYNREMSRFSRSTVKALAQQITSAQLENAEREILSDKWDYYLLFTHNCTHFTSAVWKATTGVSFRTAVFPFVLQSQLPSDRTVQLYIG